MITTRYTYRSDIDGLEDYYLLIQDEKTVAATGGKVVVYLHGHGGLPEQLFTHGRFQSKILGFPAMATAAGWTILAPNLRGNAWMNRQAEQDLLRLHGEWRQRFQPALYVLTGGSMGGTAALIWEGLHPTSFDGFIAYCGAADMVEYHRFCRERQAERPILKELADTIEERYGGSPAQAPEEYERRSAVRRAGAFCRPTIYTHGALDAVIPAGPARQLARATVGNTKVRYVEIADGDHDSIISPEGFIADLESVERAAGTKECR